MMQCDFLTIAMPHFKSPQVSFLTLYLTMWLWHNYSYQTQLQLWLCFSLFWLYVSHLLLWDVPFCLGWVIWPKNMKCFFFLYHSISISITIPGLPTLTYWLWDTCFLPLSCIQPDKPYRNLLCFFFFSSNAQK